MEDKNVPVEWFTNCPSVLSFSTFELTEPRRLRNNDNEGVTASVVEYGEEFNSKSFISFLALIAVNDGDNDNKAVTVSLSFSASFNNGLLLTNAEDGGVILGDNERELCDNDW